MLKGSINEEGPERIRKKHNPINVSLNVNLKTKAAPSLSGEILRGSYF